MALKIEQECDWCNTRESVELPRDLKAVPLPAGWAEKPEFPGGRVGPKGKQELCATCQGEFDDVLLQGERAQDAAFEQAMARARGRAAPVATAPGKQSSSFRR